MEENNNNNKQNDSINISLGTTVFIAALSALAFMGFVFWVSLKIVGLA